MNDEQKQMEFLRKKLNEFPELKPLMDKLLNIDGKFIVSVPEPDLKKILAYGKRVDDYKVIFKPMIPCHCHNNVIKLCLEGKGRMATGWALSDDGLWRQHSWLVKDKTIIETTESRKRYFGIILNSKVYKTR